LGYHDHAWARDEDYVMFARNDGSEALLFDIEEDPEMRRSVADARQDVLKAMWNEYVLGDAGGPLPRY
jgi:hypothetical protein